MNIHQGLEQTEAQLESCSEYPILDAQVLLAHILTKPRSWVMAHPDHELNLEQQDALLSSTGHLVKGEPLPYILGHWEFFGLDFEVTSHVLIPRPETELLVEKALDWLERHPSLRSAIDVGTGSGCIAISLASRIHDLRLVATDISPKALEIAKRNAEKYSVTDRIDFQCCDLFPSDKKSFDLIVANLPYIPTDKMKVLPIFGKEPTLALDGGFDGLDLLRKLITSAPKFISPDGLILLEIESSKGKETLSLAYNTFPAASIHLHRDLAGQDRLIEIQIHPGSENSS
jgi:release factor glutamine methyltransferase